MSEFIPRADSYFNAMKVKLGLACNLDMMVADMKELGIKLDQLITVREVADHIMKAHAGAVRDVEPGLNEVMEPFIIPSHELPDNTKP